jgi:hypothetical protein
MKSAIMNDSIRLSERILLSQFRKVFCHNGRLGSKTMHPKEKQSQTDFHSGKLLPRHRGSGQWQANHNTYPQPETFQLRPRPNVTLGSRPTKRESVRSRSNHRPQRQSQPKIDHGVQSPLGKIRCILRQLGALQCPLARRQATRLPDPMQ